MEELLAKRLATLSLNQTSFTHSDPSKLKIAYFIGSELNGRDVKWKKFTEKLQYEFSIEQVTGDMICQDCLVNHNFHILFMPGGFPSEHFFHIGEEIGREKVKSFLRERGKGYVGSCAGAYVALAQKEVDGTSLAEFMPKTLDLLEVGVLNFSHGCVTVMV